ncbi:hypothetical protein D9613_010757 [Agrocybe pediades]|uniref:Uncharacterized protein n=1 Tax=Agrocybe pediades TaxID=84607 RepID=A0A8H4QMZ0_9AGAR|nr:hypothetical protein D9613_010757 [Agrocybe pediades]
MANQTIPVASLHFFCVLHPDNAARADAIYPQSTVASSPSNDATSVIVERVHSPSLAETDAPKKIIFGQLGSFSAVKCEIPLHLAAYPRPKTVQRYVLGRCLSQAKTVMVQEHSVSNSEGDCHDHMAGQGASVAEKLRRSLQGISTYRGLGDHGHHIRARTYFARSATATVEVVKEEESMGWIATVGGIKKARKPRRSVIHPCASLCALCCEGSRCRMTQHCRYRSRKSGQPVPTTSPFDVRLYITVLHDFVILRLQSQPFILLI